jgi:beta-lactamase class A
MKLFGAVVLTVLALALPCRAVHAESLAEIAERAKPGVLGVAVLDLRTGAIESVNGTQPLPMMSVFKAPLAAAILAKVDGRALSLDKPVTVAWSDTRDGVGPIDGSGGGTFTVRDMLQAMLLQSDNTAADLLLQLAGGPEAVTAWLQRNNLDGIRIDRGERGIARDQNGIPPDLFPDRNASSLRVGIKMEARRAAFAAALTDPRDRATPEAMVHFLAALQQGKLLTGSSTHRLLAWMKETTTGPKRLKAGLPPHAELAHKTGTSMTFEGVTLATNDVGITTLPDGRTVAIAAFLTDSALPEAGREALLAAVMRSVAAGGQAAK